MAGGTAELTENANAKAVMTASERMKLFVIIYLSATANPRTPTPMLPFEGFVTALFHVTPVISLRSSLFAERGNAAMLAIT
jgi:cell division protein FtsW (lipid II flippase)